MFDLTGKNALVTGATGGIGEGMPMEKPRESPHAGTDATSAMPLDDHAAAALLVAAPLVLLLPPDATSVVHIILLDWTNFQ